jgi:HEAT repeat protein
MMDSSENLTSAGTFAIRWPYYSGAGQKWRFKANGSYDKVVNVNSGLTLDVDSASLNRRKDDIAMTLVRLPTNLFPFKLVSLNPFYFNRCQFNRCRLNRCEHDLLVLLSSCLLIAIVAIALPVRANAYANRANRVDRNIDVLFGDEIRQATTKVKWHGEPLTPDTIYALALTGASWEVAWGKDHLFSLARTDSHRGNGRKGRTRDQRQAERTVADNYRQRDYRGVVRAASANFSLDEISSNPDLKEAVGTSFMELGQPERAFAIFAAPYQPRAEGKRDSRESAENVSDSNRLFREGAFDAARRAGLQKEAIAFALSLLLEPGTESPGVHVAALRYLDQSGVDMERVLVGVLEAPEHLRGLTAYTYAAADLLVLHATPHLLPIFVQMSESDDAYLRARALLGLGEIAYQARPGDHNGWGDRIVPAALHEYGISNGQRKLILQKARDAANDGHYRLRAAAALALGLMGIDDALPILHKLAKDRAYTISPPMNERTDRPRRLRFPVREAASAALARYGVDVDPGGGELEGRALDAARRGGQDVTNDRSRLRHDVVSALLISPTDILPPLDEEEPR